MILGVYTIPIPTEVLPYRVIQGQLKLAKYRANWRMQGLREV